MEKNRSLIFKLVGSVLVLGVAGAVLFGLTGVLHDPVVEATSQVEKAQPQASADQKPPPSSESPPSVTPPASSPADGGTTDESIAVKEEEAFPQFDEEPHGS